MHASLSFRPVVCTVTVTVTLHTSLVPRPIRLIPRPVNPCVCHKDILISTVPLDELLHAFQGLEVLCSKCLPDIPLHSCVTSRFTFRPMLILQVMVGRSRSGATHTYTPIKLSSHTHNLHTPPHPSHCHPTHLHLQC